MADYERLRERHLAEFAALVPEHLERLRWPVERIREERERRLRMVLGAASERSSWHAGRLADVDPATATEADLTRIPPMTKDDMMEHLDGIFTDARLSRRLVEAHVDTLVEDAYLLDEFHVFASGGSSGRRGVFVYDWNGWMWFTLSLVRFVMRARLADSELDPEAVEAVVAAEKASHT
jgi:phenylacetate-coenzyme A ligase PaaK-like adenylate-forming protein